MFKEWRSADGQRLESRRSLVARSISSSHYVTAVDPDSLAIAHNPASWSPDVIGAAYIVPRTAHVVGPIAHLHSNGTGITRVRRSPIIRTAAIATTVIWSVARVGAVIAATSY